MYRDDAGDGQLLLWLSSNISVCVAPRLYRPRTATEFQHFPLGKSHYLKKKPLRGAACPACGRLLSLRAETVARSRGLHTVAVAATGTVPVQSVRGEILSHFCLPARNHQKRDSISLLTVPGSH